MNMAEDSHQLLQFAIENDDTDIIHLILINESTLHQQGHISVFSLSFGSFISFSSTNYAKYDMQKNALSI